MRRTPCFEPQSSQHLAEEPAKGRSSSVTLWLDVTHRVVLLQSWCLVGGIKTSQIHPEQPAGGGGGVELGDEVGLGLEVGGRGFGGGDDVLEVGRGD